MKESEFYKQMPDGESDTLSTDDDSLLLEKIRNLKLSGQHADTVELASSERIVASLKLFTETFKPKTDLIYYPCCANDISPTLAFGDSRVVYVDISAPDVQALQEKGFEAHEAVAGWTGSMIMGTNEQQGVLLNIVVGIIGAVLGGYIMSLFGEAGVTGFNIYSFLVAIIGAIALLGIVRLVRRA